VLARRRALAALAAAGALTFVSVMFACGGDPASDEEPPTDTPDAGLPEVTPPLPAAATCKTDGDCAAKGGKCLVVGGGQKACVATKSCTGGDGANNTCGGVAGNEMASGTSDCCQTIAVPGGSFNRFNDPQYPAKVSPFLLDAYEVTAGRFRAYVEATNGNLRGAAPKVGDGAHPKVKDSGWRAEWNAVLPTSRAEVDAMLGPEKCVEGSNIDDFGTLTWWTSGLEAAIKQKNGSNAAVLAANTKSALDSKGVNCVPWHVLMAFCIWDGGRLPTDAEWSFAAQGGSEQRMFPWGSIDAKDLVHIDGRNDLSQVPVIKAGSPFLVASLYDPSLGANKFPANYTHTWGGPFRTTRDNASHVAPVGRRAKGNGKWGHADMAGGMYEWTMDEGPIPPGQCTDCAKVDYPALDGFDPKAMDSTIPDFPHVLYAGGSRSVRGGAWDNSLGLSNSQSEVEIETYTSYPVKRTYRSLGGRCARDL
jgi:formylglycine-generating enzyme required for sulfatase activity